MAFVYILYSKSANQYYTGSCKDLGKRVDQHFTKEIAGAFTSKAVDWIIYLSIDDLMYKQARDIENHIKRMKSRKYIENLKEYPELVQKIKMQYQ